MRPSTPIRSFLLACALTTGLVFPAGASAAPAPAARDGARLATPQLLDAAVAAGRIDQASANLYLAYALSPLHDQVPVAYRGDAPWDGTLPLLGLRHALAAGTAGRYAGKIRSVIDGPDRATAANSCSSFPAAVGGANQHLSTHFLIDYGTIAGGLSIASYATSLETSWGTEVDAFGWAAPPLHPGAGGRYHVVIDDLDPGLYGFVDNFGTFAGAAGDNPNTAWTESDAQRSCMALNRDYSGFPGSSQQALDATTAHEFNHSIQFGYGALTPFNEADSVFVEGGATWMEDEVFDGSNDNHNYLWPDFTFDMGQYTPSPYPYWVVFRAITERYGAGVADGGEDVMQRFWEAHSQGTANNLGAMNAALVAEGTTLADAYHGAAVALRFDHGCGGGYVAPYCLEEGPAYVAAVPGAPPIQGTIASAGGSFNGSVRDNYALSWVKLPSTGTYDVSLSNTAAAGQLRGSVACDTGSTISVIPLPTVAGGGQTSTLAGFSAAGCLANSVYAVITNQNQTGSNPGAATKRNYTLSTTGGGGGGADVNVAEKDFAFAPKAPTAQQGDTVQWNFNGPSNHTATDSTTMALFGSGSKPSGSTYQFTFLGAGNYSFTCTIHPSQMAGTIKVPVKASPGSGGTSTSFTITWASGAPPAGFDFDIQVKRPGQKWKPWMMDQTGTSGSFVPNVGPGTYRFRARLERNSNGATSKWSAVKSITVS